MFLFFTILAFNCVKRFQKRENAPLPPQSPPITHRSTKQPPKDRPERQDGDGGGVRGVRQHQLQQAPRLEAGGEPPAQGEARDGSARGRGAGRSHLPKKKTFVELCLAISLITSRTSTHLTQTIDARVFLLGENPPQPSPNSRCVYPPV
jgi:hypothetical protein